VISPPDVLITGATGNVGAPLVERFQRDGQPVRAGVRSPDEAALGAGVEAVRLDFRDPATFAPAVAGVRAVFLVRPPAIADVEATLIPFLEAAERAGVRHVVFLSLQGADRNPLAPHRKVEQWLAASAMAWTFLRPSFFFQNLSTTHRAEIRDRGEIFVPAGRGRTAFVDTRDVADVAFLALTAPGHERQAYTLTGAEALTYGEVAAVLSAVLSREIRYARPSLWAFWRRQRAEGTPAGFVAVMMALYTVCRLGLAGGVTDTLLRLLGRPPRSLRDFADDHRDRWTRPV
jgi:uncharacterized protein YbjT (DUF2867 family)